MMKPRFTADIETLLYIGSALCVAVAIGILITPYARPQNDKLSSNIIDATAIEALSPAEIQVSAPGRVTEPMRLDTVLTNVETASPEELIVQGRQALDKGNGRQALDLLLRAKEKGMTSVEVLALIADAYNTSRNFDQAATEAATILRSAPDNAQAKLVLAEALMHQAGMTENEAKLDEAANLLASIPQEAKSAFLSCIISTYRNNTRNPVSRRSKAALWMPVLQRISFLSSSCFPPSATVTVPI